MKISNFSIFTTLSHFLELKTLQQGDSIEIGTQPHWCCINILNINRCSLICAKVLQCHLKVLQCHQYTDVTVVFDKSINSPAQILVKKSNKSIALRRHHHLYLMRIYSAEIIVARLGKIKLSVGKSSICVSRI